MENITQVVQFYKRQLDEGKIDPDFFEFIRRIETVSQGGAIGDSFRYRKEPVRFGQIPTLKFSNTTIESIANKKYPTVFVNFMGLTGPNGPLPLTFTGVIYNRIHNHYDFTIQRLNDIINHRFIGLFYRAWKANEMAVSLDQKDGGLIANILSSIAGHIKGVPHMPEMMDIGYSGIMCNATKSKDGLETILRNYYQTNLRVIEHVESTADIPKNNRCKLGQAGCSSLGENIQLGNTYYTRSRKIRIEIGPISYEEAKQKFHSARGLDVMKRILGAYLPHPMEQELKLVLVSDTIVFPKLNGTMRLGHDVWLHSEDNIKKPIQVMQL